MLGPLGGKSNCDSGSAMVESRGRLSSSLRQTMLFYFFVIS
jgi:hypothetical protein